MTIVAKERAELSGGDDNRRVTWYVSDDANSSITPATAVAAALAAAPTSVDGFPYAGYSYDEIGVDKYDVELRYSHSGSSGSSERDVQEGEAQYSFETTLESVKIFRSLGRIASHYDAALQPNTNQTAVDGLFPNAINVDADGKVNGTTIQVPVSRFRYRYRIPNATVTQAYQNKVEELAGYVNSVPYKGRAAGSVRFDGANGTFSTDGTWDVDFRFTRRPNLTNETIGAITGVSADGWDYIWPYFIPFRDDDGLVTPNPAYVFVDRIYPRDDFAILRIP